MVAQGAFALIGVILLFLAAVGVTAQRVSLALLGAACIATAITWPAISHLFT